MNKLIINTANADLVILLIKNNEIFYKLESSVKKHNERILVLIKELLNEHDLLLKDIDEYGVVIGPGSFTGIRVGIATVKAFKDAYGKKAKGINNLALLKEMADENINFFAIEGSMDSFFVAERINDKLYINTRNLFKEELKNLAGENKVACFKLSEQMKESDINFVEIPFNAEGLKNSFENSEDTSLVPVYYQLSQAENDKINRADLILAELKVEDLDEILEIENENFKKGTTGDEPLNISQLETIVRNKMPNFVAKINDNIVGYIFAEKTDEINISRVAVKSGYQNHGIASQMINYLEELAKKENINMSLEVSENNITAYKLYTKLGYTTRRIRKNYYKDGSSCLEMVKQV